MELDKILIKDILVRCIIGVNDDERREKQDVIITISISADLRQAGKSDDFRDTIDYRGIKKRIVTMVESSEYQLLEALAERVAEMCLEHPAASEAQVTVEKPGALRFARSVGVEITRRRE